MDDRRVTVALEAARAGGAVAERLFRGDLAIERKTGKTDVVTRADREAQERVVDRIRETCPEEVVVGEESDAPTEVPETGPAWVVDPIDGTHNYVSGVGWWATSVAALLDGEPVAAANVMPAVGDTYVAGPGGDRPAGDGTGAGEPVRRNGDAVSVSDRTDPDTCTVVPTIWWELDDRAVYAGAARAIVTRFGDLARFKSAQATLSLLAAGGVDGAFATVDSSPWDTVAGVHMVRRAGGRVTDLDGDPWTHSSRGLVASNGHVHDRVLAAAHEAVAAGEGTTGG